MNSTALPCAAREGEAGALSSADVAVCERVELVDAFPFDLDLDFVSGHRAFVVLLASAFRMPWLYASSGAWKSCTGFSSKQ